VRSRFQGYTAIANYTHRVAIANSRIRDIEEATGKVTITYRHYADGQNQTAQTLRHRVRPRLQPASTPATLYQDPALRDPREQSKINRHSRSAPALALFGHGKATACARASATNAAPVGCTRCHIGQMRLFALSTLRGAFRAEPPLLDSS